MSENKFEEYFKELLSFGLNSDEARVYLALLKKGKNGDIIGNLFNELEIKRPTIYKIIYQLIEKRWVSKGGFSNTPKRAQIFVARPPLRILNELIEKSEKKLNNLKEQCLFIGDNLEKIYLKHRKLTIYDIYPSTVKYLKPLFKKKWIVLSEVIEQSKVLGRKVFDYEFKSYKSDRKDAGLIIFDYDRNIENDKKLTKSALNMFKNKMKYDIKSGHNSIVEDLKIVDEKIQGYLGGNTFLKFKEGSPPVKFMGTDWVHAGKYVVIPIKYKIFLIWAELKNFSFLMESVLSVK